MTQFYFLCNYSDKNNVKAQKFKKMISIKQEKKNASFCITLGNSGTSTENYVQ